MTIEYVKAQIKKYIDESKTNGELFRKVMDLYMKDDSIPIETREKTGNLIEKYYYNKENIESIEPKRKKGEWIPVSETSDIPEKEVLACNKYGELMFGFLSGADGKYECDSDNELMCDVVAWMKKPKPYKENKHE